MNESESIENIHGNDGQTATNPPEPVQGTPANDVVISHHTLGSAVARLTEKRNAPSAWRGRGSKS